MGSRDHCNCSSSEKVQRAIQVDKHGISTKGKVVLVPDTTSTTGATRIRRREFCTNALAPGVGAKKITVFKPELQTAPVRCCSILLAAHITGISTNLTGLSKPRSYSGRMRPPENEILRDLPTFYAVQVLADALHVLFTFKLKLFGSVPCKIPDFPFPAHFKMLQLENAV
eukprot:3932904-Rhodomonas_salina.1